MPCYAMLGYVSRAVQGVVVAKQKQNQLFVDRQ